MLITHDDEGEQENRDFFSFARLIFCSLSAFGICTIARRAYRWRKKVSSAKKIRSIQLMDRRWKVRAKKIVFFRVQTTSFKLHLAICRQPFVPSTTTNFLKGLSSRLRVGFSAETFSHYFYLFFSRDEKQHEKMCIQPCCWVEPCARWLRDVMLSFVHIMHAYI